MYDNANDQHHDPNDHPRPYTHIDPTTTSIILPTPSLGRKERMAAGARLAALGGRSSSLLAGGENVETVFSLHSDDAEAGGVRRTMSAEVATRMNIGIEEETEHDLGSDFLLDADVGMGRGSSVGGVDGIATSENGTSPSFFKIPGKHYKLHRKVDTTLPSSTSTPSLFNTRSNGPTEQQRSTLRPSADESTPAHFHGSSSASTYSSTQSFFASPGKSSRNDRRRSRDSSFTSMDDRRDFQVVRGGEVKPHKKGKGIESIVKNKSSGEGKVGGLMRSLMKGFGGGSSAEAASSSSSPDQPVTVQPPPVQPSSVQPPPIQTTLQSQLHDLNVVSSAELQNAHEQSIGIGAFRLDRKGRIIGYGSGLGSRRGSRDMDKSGGDSRRGTAASQGSQLRNGEDAYSQNQSPAIQSTSSSPKRPPQSPQIKDTAVVALSSPTTQNQTPRAMHATFVRPITPTWDRHREHDPAVSPTKLPRTTTTMMYPPTPSSSSAVTATSNRLSSMSGSSHFTASSHTSGGSNQRRGRSARSSAFLGAAVLPPVRPAPGGVLPPTPDGNGNANNRSSNAVIPSSPPTLIESSSSGVPIVMHLDHSPQDGEVNLLPMESVMHFIDPIDGKSYAIPPSMLKAFLGAGIKMDLADGREAVPATTAAKHLLPPLANSQEMARTPSGTSTTMSVSSMGDSQTTPLDGLLDLPAIEPPLRSPGGTLVVEADGMVSPVGGKVHDRDSTERMDSDVLGSQNTSDESASTSPEQRERLRGIQSQLTNKWDDEGVGFGLGLEDNVRELEVCPMEA